MTELLVWWRPLRFLYRQIVARIPLPALRATFPPGEGFVGTASFCWGAVGDGRLWREQAPAIRYKLQMVPVTVSVTTPGFTV